MIPKSVALYESALRAATLPELEPLRLWLKEQQATSMQTMETAEGAAMHRAQGAYGQLRRIFELFEAAPAALQRARSQSPHSSM